MLELLARALPRADGRAVERQRYNETVQAYNTSRRQFPANITAAIFGFKGDYPLFTAPEGAKAAPKVDFKKTS